MKKIGILFSGCGAYDGEEARSRNDGEEARSRNDGEEARSRNDREEARRGDAMR